MFFRPQHDLKTAQIAPVVPDCPRCRTVMHMGEIFPHPRFPRVEIVSFNCDCGRVDRRVVPHVFDQSHD